MQFNITGTLVPQAKSYDNAGAHNAIKSMMQRKETLSIRLYTDKDNYPYIWIESYNVAGFKYYVTPISFKWIYTYLTTGESEDGGIQPTELTPYQTGEDNNFQLSILKQLIESGKRVQFVPLFREVNNYISASTVSYLFRKYLSLLLILFASVSSSSVLISLIALRYDSIKLACGLVGTFSLVDFKCVFWSN